MTPENRVACELERAVATLEEREYHPNVNLMTPQEVICLVKSVLFQVAKDLQNL